MPVERFVLARFSDEQWLELEDTLERAAEGIRFFIELGVDAAMNRVNRRA